MPKLLYDSSDEQPPSSSSRLFGRQRPLHNLFGGGRVADILLWRDKRLSAGILVAVTMIWFLFEVAEYHFLTLLCHLSIVIMLVVFIWSNVFLCIHTLPALYEQYEAEVDHLATKGSKDLKKLFKKIDSRVLKKIPRGPVKEKKFK